MIFLTVGNVDPFDRLVQAVDRWVADNRSQSDVFAQIGNGRYLPQHCQFTDFLTPEEYRKIFSEADFVISHAGMGTIITAIEMNKLVVVLPRRGDLGELRNEHQLATVRHFRKSQHIRVAESEHDLPAVLDSVVFSPDTPWRAPMNSTTAWLPDKSLIDFVRQFICQPPT